MDGFQVISMHNSDDGEAKEKDELRGSVNLSNKTKEEEFLLLHQSTSRMSPAALQTFKNEQRDQ